MSDSMRLDELSKLDSLEGEQDETKALPCCVSCVLHLAALHQNYCSGATLHPASDQLSLN